MGISDRAIDKVVQGMFRASIITKNRDTYIEELIKALPSKYEINVYGSTDEFLLNKSEIDTYEFDSLYLNKYFEINELVIIISDNKQAMKNDKIRIKDTAKHHICVRTISSADPNKRHNIASRLEPQLKILDCNTEKQIAIFHEKYKHTFYKAFIKSRNENNIDFPSFVIQNMQKCPFCLTEGYVLEKTHPYSYDKQAAWTIGCGSCKREIVHHCPIVFAPEYTMSYYSLIESGGEYMTTITEDKLEDLIAQATVVISDTDSTAYAIALRYIDGIDDEPKVLVCGKDAIAISLLNLAKVHTIPTYEDSPLAIALYENTKIGETIPTNLFQSVVEVLVFVNKHKNAQVG